MHKVLRKIRKTKENMKYSKERDVKMGSESKDKRKQRKINKGRKIEEHLKKQEKEKIRKDVEKDSKTSVLAPRAGFNSQ